jgi:hypothetical protein
MDPSLHAPMHAGAPVRRDNGAVWRAATRGRVLFVSASLSS